MGAFDAFSLYTQTLFSYPVRHKNQAAGGIKTGYIHSNIFCNLCGFVKKRNRKLYLAGMAALSLFLTGCVLLSALPVTLKELKDYTVGQQQSFAYPIDDVLTASSYTLRESSFTIVRIEQFNRNALVKAGWNNTLVEFSMESVTPKLTKVNCKIRRGDKTPEYSSEKELFSKVRETLEKERKIDWAAIVKDMVCIHIRPDESSPIVGYLGQGSTAKVMDEAGGWKKVELMDNHYGYVPFESLQ